METNNLPVISNDLKLTENVAKKFETSKEIKLNLSKSKASVKHKQKGHKEGRMKVTLKFAKDEAEGFTNFCKLAKPDNMNQDDFVKFLFYKGVQALQQDFASKLEEFKQKDPEGFAKMQAEADGSQPIQEGSVTVATDNSNQ